MSDTPMKTTSIVPSDNGPTLITKKTISAGARINSSAPSPAAETPAAPPTETAQTNSQSGGEEAKVPPAGEKTGEGQETKQEPSADDLRLARLSKVERRIKEREAQVEAQLKAMAEKEARLQEAEEWLQLPKKAKEDPVGALNKLGIEFEELAQAIINGGKPPAEKVQSDKLDELSQKINAFEEQQAELRRLAQMEAERTAAVEYVKAGHEFVQTNAEEFELIRSKGNQAWDDVWQLAEETYRQTGEVPDIKDVVKIVESYYEEEALTAFKSAKKLAKKLGLPDPTTAGLTPEAKKAVEEAARDVANPKVTVKPIAPTLGGKMSQAVPGPIKPGEKLSDKEKLARIIAWGNAELSKKSG